MSKNRRTHQIQIVLNDIVLEGRRRKSSIAKTSDESMFSMSSPRRLDIGSFQKILNKSAPTLRCQGRENKKLEG